jgi:hypothetical protein
VLVSHDAFARNASATLRTLLTDLQAVGVHGLRAVSDGVHYSARVHSV